MRFLAFAIPVTFMLAFPMHSLAARFACQADPDRALALAQAARPAASQQAPVFQGIAGQIVDSATRAPISGGEAIVALEQPDGTGTDVVFTQMQTDSSGRFSFSPLPLANSFDLVAVAINGNGAAYDATVVMGIPVGTHLGVVPLIAEVGDQDGPAKLTGIVTATSGTAPSTIRAIISAIQTVSLHGGLSLSVDVPLTVTISGADYRPVTIPGERGTSANMLLKSTAVCAASGTSNSNCGDYVIVVPGSNPSVAIFASGSAAYQPPAAGPARYIVRANAFAPYGTAASVCIPSFQSAGADAQSDPVKVSPGGTAATQTIAFTGCW